MRPIVKWAGGKTRLLPALAARLPARFGRYYEPFAGGAALFFGLQPQRAVLGDVNDGLIGMYKAVRDDVEGVIALLPHFAAEHGEAFYDQVKGNWNADAWATDPVAQAAAFLYLNRAGFNGLWRVNGDGELNTPWGQRETVSFDFAKLRAASRVLRRAELRCADYREACADVAPGDLVFLDPPYDPVSETANFATYAKDGFGPQDQRDLGAFVRDLAGRGVHVLVSNNDTPLVREIFAGMRIDVVGCDRRIAASGASRGQAAEVIVSTSGRAVDLFDGVRA